VSHLQAAKKVSVVKKYFSNVSPGTNEFLVVGLLVNNPTFRQKL